MEGLGVDRLLLLRRLTGEERGLDGDDDSGEYEGHGEEDGNDGRLPASGVALRRSHFPPRRRDRI